MKLITLFVVIIVVLASITNKEPVTTATASISDVQKLGTSSTEFGLNLYNELRKDTSLTNIFLSPASISLALSMVLLGAKGTAYSTFERALPEIPKNVILDEFASGLKHACVQM